MGHEILVSLFAFACFAGIGIQSYKFMNKSLTHPKKDQLYPSSSGWLFFRSLQVLSKDEDDFSPAYKSALIKNTESPYTVE